MVLFVMYQACRRLVTSACVDMYKLSSRRLRALIQCMVAIRTSVSKTFSFIVVIGRYGICKKNLLHSSSSRDYVHFGKPQLFIDLPYDLLKTIRKNVRRKRGICTLSRSLHLAKKERKNYSTSQFYIDSK